MFIKDGKSLFKNTGLIVSLLILIILLVLGYKKCSAPELFEGESTSSSTQVQATPAPQNVRISIANNSVSVNFTVDISNKLPIPTKFIIVVAQYDNTLQNTGNNKYFLSNENELINNGFGSGSGSGFGSGSGSGSGSSISSSIGASILASAQTSHAKLCTLINGLPSCSYTFTNLDTLDESGNLYYYKLGVSAVYDWGNSSFITPYNLYSANKLFTLDTSIDQQTNVYNQFLQYKQHQKQLGQPLGVLSNGSGSTDGQYELIKSQLGNYPSNLLLDPTSATQALLSDLVDKSMAQGILNVNIAVAPTKSIAK